MDTSGRANVGIIRTTSKLLFLVDLFEFDIRLRALCRRECECQIGSTSAEFRETSSEAVVRRHIAGLNNENVIR